MSKSRHIYQCNDCGREYGGDEIMYLCPACSAGNSAGQPPRGVLKTLYDYDAVRRSSPSFAELRAGKFISLLPIETIESMTPLRIGNTPLYRLTSSKVRKMLFRLYLKDDSQNPTWSFKDRASALVSAYARERGVQTIVTASTGNAGSSLAGICASQGQRAVILVPEAAPPAKLTQIVMYGATLVPVKGTYDDAFALSIKATEHFGWYNRNTAFNPLTIEGKKSVSFELYEQLGFRLPDTVFVPVGDGVILSGLYKGFEDLLRLQITDHMPVVVAVQSAGSDNLVRNIPHKDFKVIPSSTIADSISVDLPGNFYMARRYISEYSGQTMTVTDEEILLASRQLAESTGLFAEPAAAAAYAGFMKYHRQGLLPDDSDNVVLLTGSGLKDTGSVRQMIKIPGAISPDIDNLEKALG
ncbi:MAG: threonine synthase [Bacteroidales bacterium]|nr:threonine synthase [Bacteroidales bacterium]MDT8374440.1 threonine synthase [Bacteroidales bacterium]